ncbi:MAG: RsmE family RNA methyltransferase [Opitutales bacterium]
MGVYRCFIFPEAKVAAGRVVLEARESHHLVRVFRARSGEAVELLNGRGLRYFGRLSRVDAGAAEVTVERIEEHPVPRPELTLLQSIPKGKTMDLILRIATEIGVARVVPVFTDQGEVQLKGERLQSKLEKWRLTMIESCKQCGLPFLPDLEEPRSIEDWIEASAGASAALKIVASLEEGSRSLLSALEQMGEIREVVVAVGPEGDFSGREYSALTRSGFRSVRLGANVLRAETAAAYTLSVVDQCLRMR